MTDAADEVRVALDALMEAFGSGDEDAYFAAFHPRATFFFYGQDLIGSRDVYRAVVRSWRAEHGFSVLASASRDARVDLFDDAAVITHRVTTLQRWDGDEVTLHERESIVFQRQPDGRWLAIHEHLSADEPPD